MPGENLPRRVWNRQTKFTYNHWLAALVKGKCSSTKPTRLASGVVCHPDTERNRPYKIPWSYQGLNRGPTAPQAITLPVCHTTPFIHVVQRKVSVVVFIRVALSTPVPLKEIRTVYVKLGEAFTV